MNNSQSRKARKWRATIPGRLNIAREILSRRSVLGMTQLEVAQKAGLQQSVISQIESLAGNPTIDTLDVIAKALDMQWIVVSRE